MMSRFGFGMGWMRLWGLLSLVGVVGKSTPRQILDERYANGELTTEQYQERVTVLEESAPGKDG